MKQVLAALALLAVVCSGAQAQINNPGGVNVGNSPFLSTTPGATTQTNSAARFGQQLNVKSDFGAAGNALSANDGTITTGTNAFSSAKATFAAADVGKTIVVDYAGAAGAPLTATIATFVDATHVTLTANASTTVPYQFSNFLVVATAQSGAGSYAPGDTVTMACASCTGTTTATVGTVRLTKVVSATINAAGSGGNTAAGATTGNCTVTGSTGSGGTPFTLSIALTAGAASAVNSIVFSGQYSTNPTSLTAEPVIGGRNPSTIGSCTGLSGATMTLTMGVMAIAPTTKGVYTSIVGSFTQASTSGAGTGATFTPGTITAGQYVYGTDDTAAISAAITSAITTNLTNGYCVYLPQAAYLISASLPTFYSAALSANGCVKGDGVNKTYVYATPTLTGPIFSWSRNFNFSQEAINGPSVIFSGQGSGPRATGIEVIGDRTGGNVQTAFALYDENAKLYFDDLDCQFMSGSCYQTGQLLHSTNAYIAEATFGTIHMNQCGNSTAPCFDLFNQGASGQGSNEVHVQTMNIYAPFGHGINIHGADIAPSTFNCDFCRVEGVEYDPVTIASNLVQIGDTTNTTTPNSLVFTNLVLVDPYPGQACFDVTASNNSNQPYQIEVLNATCGGGLPFGRGLQLDFVRASEFHFNSMNTFDANLFLGSAANISVPLQISGPAGIESSWSVSDAGGASVLSSPIVRLGLATASAPAAGASLMRHNTTFFNGNALGAGAIDWSSGKALTTYNASASNSTIAGGFRQTANGVGSAIGGGQDNFVSGNFSGIPAGKFVTDRGNYASFCHGAGSVAGNNQSCWEELRCQAAATNASTCVMTADGAAAGTANIMNIPNSAVYTMTLDCDGISASTPGNNEAWPAWTMKLSRGVGVATTTLVANTTPTPLTSGTVTGSTIAAAADTTNGGVTITFTAPSTNAALWNTGCRVLARQTQ